MIIRLSCPAFLFFTAGNAETAEFFVSLPPRDLGGLGGKYFQF